MSTHEQGVQAVGLALQRGFNRLKERLMYFTECQLATVEDVRGRSRFPKRGVERHESIARQMVNECAIHGLTSDNAGLAKCPRLFDELKKRGK